MINARAATLMDLAHVTSIVNMAADEGAFLVDRCEFSPSNAKETLHAVLGDPDALAIIYEVDLDLAGVIMATVEPHPWMDIQFTNMILQYVMPEYRAGGQILNSMLAVLEAYAEKHAAYPALQITSGLRVEPYARLLSRKGYQLVGSNFIKGDSNVGRKH